MKIRKWEREEMMNFRKIMVVDERNEDSIIDCKFNGLLLDE